MKRVVLVGAANSGKTTLFNRLTRSHYTTVNYPGATVEYALGEAAGADGEFEVMDTPGLASLVPGSPDERVTVEALFDQFPPPRLLVAVVDATQLSRHLYLVHQLKAAGFPLVVAVTMSDLLEARGRRLDTGRLADMLDLPVIALNPRRVQEGERLRDFLAPLLAKDAPSPFENLESLQNKIDDNYVANAYQWADLVESECIQTVGTEGDSQYNRFQLASIDGILMHPVWGLAIFILTLATIFTAVFWVAAPLMNGIDVLFAGAVDFAKAGLPSSWLTDLFADGIIAGVGAVAVFLPQIVILFAALGLLEDSGYLARGAALVDRPLSAIGLNGRSMVPLLSGYACAIPAILASRTIPHRFERLLTIFIIPLMSCSARLPVYSLLLAFLVPRDKPWLGGLGLTALYFSGFAMGALVSTAVSRFLFPGQRDSGFVLELPALRKPLPRIILTSTYHKSLQYVKKAGLTILVIAAGLWVLTHTPMPGAAAPVVKHSPTAPAEDPRRPPDAFQPADPDRPSEEYVAISGSLAGALGRWIEPAMRPMGLDWRAGVAMICGFAAREVFVSSLALMYRIEGEDEEGVSKRLLSAMHTARNERTGEAVFTVSSCLGILVFFMVALQCFPTVVVARKEYGGWPLALLQLGLFTGGAYALSTATVQGLRALGVT